MSKQEEGMEKYGVDESQTERTKQASRGCPHCGGKVTDCGNLLACERCGTEPFEEKR